MLAIKEAPITSDGIIIFMVDLNIKHDVKDLIVP